MTGAAILMFLVLWLLLLGMMAGGAAKTSPTKALVLFSMSGLLALGIGAIGFAFELLAHGLWDAMP